MDRLASATARTAVSYSIMVARIVGRGAAVNHQIEADLRDPELYGFPRHKVTMFDVVEWHPQRCT